MSRFAERELRFVEPKRVTAGAELGVGRTQIPGSSFGPCQDGSSRSIGENKQRNGQRGYGEEGAGNEHLSRGTSTHRAPTRAAARRALGMELRRAIRILLRGRLT